MALQKSIPTDFSPSVSAAYWRIVGAQYDADAQALAITVAGYCTAADRSDGRPPISAMRFRYEGVSAAEVDYERAYQRLTAEPAFAGATAV